MPTASVAIMDVDGRILLGRRSDDGSWSLPGGRLEPGESLADCARRECREELGCEVELDGLLAVLSNPSTQVQHYPDGRTVQFVGVLFRGRPGPRRGAWGARYGSTPICPMRQRAPGAPTSAPAPPTKDAFSPSRSSPGAGSTPSTPAPILRPSMRVRENGCGAGGFGRARSARGRSAVASPMTMGGSSPPPASPRLSR